MSIKQDEKEDAYTSEYLLNRGDSLIVSMLVIVSTIDAWEKLLNLFAELRNEIVDILS